MSAATCKTCPYMMPLTTHGECHHDTPARFTADDPSGEWPYVLDYDWCGSHPDRQPHLECATTTLVRREAFPTERDIGRILDALEKIASRAQRGAS